MKARGWQQLDVALPPVLPSGDLASNVELKALTNAMPIYQKILGQMKSAFSGNLLEILSIEEIKNTELQNVYEQAKRQIQRQTSLSDGNEMMLFHGAKGKCAYLNCELFRTLTIQFDRIEILYHSIY